MWGILGAYLLLRLMLKLLPLALVFAAVFIHSGGDLVHGVLVVLGLILAAALLRRRVRSHRPW